MTVALPAGINELLRRDHCRWLLIDHQRWHSKKKKLNIDRFLFFLINRLWVRFLLRVLDKNVCSREGVLGLNCEQKSFLIDAFGGNLIDVENEYLTSGKSSV